MRIFIVITSAVVGLISLFFFYLPTDLWSLALSSQSKSKYARVVALAPSMSETVIALHQAHRLVGVTIHCQSKEVQGVPKVGSFAEPNFEAIIAQNPDLVLAVPHVMAKNVLDRLAENHIEVFAYQPDSLSDIKNIIKALAKKFDAIKTGEELIEKIDKTLKDTQVLLTQGTQPARGKTTLIAVSAVPLVVAGKPTFPSQIIEALGLVNMASNATIPWPVWALENLIANPPAFFIVTDGAINQHQYQNIFLSLGLTTNNTTSIKIIVPQYPIFQSPSPLIIDDINYLATLLNTII